MNIKGQFRITSECSKIIWYFLNTCIKDILYSSIEEILHVLPYILIFFISSSETYKPFYIIKMRPHFPHSHSHSHSLYHFPSFSLLELFCPQLIYYHPVLVSRGHIDSKYIPKFEHVLWNFSSKSIEFKGAIKAKIAHLLIQSHFHGMFIEAYQILLDYLSQLRPSMGINYIKVFLFTWQLRKMRKYKNFKIS